MQDIPLSGISFAILFLVMAAATVRTWKSYREKGSSALRDMAVFFGTMGIFQFTMTWPHLFWQNPDFFRSVMHWSQLIGFAFYNISVAFLASATLRFKWREARKPLFYIILAIGMAQVATSWLLPNHPMVDPKTGFTVFGDIALVGILTGMAALLGYGTLALVFLSELPKINSGALKRRAILLSSGGICILVGGPMHATTKAYLSLFGDILLLIGFGLIWGGVFLLHLEDATKSSPAEMENK